ncbi:hypothetical protein VTL71DRAFT_11026, partial [Oculimacula yallundae]
MNGVLTRGIVIEPRFCYTTKTPSFCGNNQWRATSSLKIGRTPRCRSRKWETLYVECVHGCMRTSRFMGWYSHSQPGRSCA